MEGGLVMSNQYQTAPLLGRSNLNMRHLLKRASALLSHDQLDTLAELVIAKLAAKYRAPAF